jgi:hypothetical protein
MTSKRGAGLDGRGWKIEEGEVKTLHAEYKREAGGIPSSY